MSPDTDEYWVGALAMVCARAQHLIAAGKPWTALQELDYILQQLAESPVFDDGLRHELASYWEPGKEVTQ